MRITAAGLAVVKWLRKPTEAEADSFCYSKSATSSLREDRGIYLKVYIRTKIYINITGPGM